MSEENLPTEQSQAGQEARLQAPDVDPRRPGHREGPTSQGPGSPVRLIWRVDRRDTFEALRRGRRRRQGPLSVTWVPGDPAEPPRAAYSIGRRVGPAVVRNRVRRQLRMLMCEASPRLAPGAYLVGAGPEAAKRTYAELRDDLFTALSHFSDTRYAGKP